MRLKNYDYYLVVLTALVLFAIGAVCVYGIAYYNYLAADPEWTGTSQYTDFIGNMDSYLYPFLVLLLVSLGLCIPKRLFEQDILLKFSAIVIGFTVLLTFLLGIETGLGFILAVMTGIQVIVLFLILNKSKAIRFEKEGISARLGSLLLHLGLVTLVLNFIALKESQLHILIFWAGTLLITIGSIFSFYPDRIASLLKY